MEKPDTKEGGVEEKNQQPETTETASDNLNNNKVETTIRPETEGNYVYVSLCSISIHCCIS
jgi:hypothetical protein